MDEPNAYDEFVAKLKDGELSMRMVCIGIKQWVRDSENIPEGTKSLLCGSENNVSLIEQIWQCLDTSMAMRRQLHEIDQLFRVLAGTIGSIEVAYRRGRCDPLEKEDDNA